ncbi:MAG: hypothetical protein ACOCP8_00590 [archaeon]
MFKGKTTTGQKVYCNPTLQEIIECIGGDAGKTKNIKFVADYKSKQVFICRKLDNTTHFQIIDMMDIDESRNDILFGNGSFAGEKIEISSATNNLIYNKVIENQFNFLTKYFFDINKYKNEIINFKKEVEKGV